MTVLKSKKYMLVRLHLGTAHLGKVNYMGTSWRAASGGSEIRWLGPPECVMSLINSDMFKSLLGIHSFSGLLDGHSLQIVVVAKIIVKLLE